jgi:hypothetical protein
MLQDWHGEDAKTCLPLQRILWLFTGREIEILEHSDCKTSSYAIKFHCIRFQWFRNCKKLCLTNLFMFEHVKIKIWQYIFCILYFYNNSYALRKLMWHQVLSFHSYRFHILTLVFLDQKFFLLIFTIFVYLNTQPNSVIIPFMVPKLSPIINLIKGLHRAQQVNNICLLYQFYCNQDELENNNYTPCKQSLGGYIGITLSVHPSMYLVSATPPKPLIGFLWNFTHL